MPDGVAGSGQLAAVPFGRLGDGPAPHADAPGRGGARPVDEPTERDGRERARARDAVRHERTQFARELHDIVDNAVAVMVLQAEAARAAGPGALAPGADDALGR
ncbi:hypothetical protein VM98_36605, partial [Streptomyces rubellomurinus subsp. indigoferus]